MRSLTKPLIVIGAAVIIGGAIAIYSFFFYSKPALKTTTPAQLMTLTQTVSADGSVVAAQDLSLAFQRGGQVTSLVGDVGTPVTAGEAIASVSSSDLEAQLEEAQAGLSTQQIKLDALEASTTSLTGSDVEVGINNAATTLLTTLTNDYQSLDGTLATDVDGLFDNPRTNPLFTVSVTAPNGQTYFINATQAQTAQLDGDRQAVNTDMAAWNTANVTAQSGSASDVNAADQAGETAIAAIQTLLSHITVTLSSYVSTDASSQAIYNTYKGNISTAEGAVSGDLTALRTAEESGVQAQTPANPYDISLQKAAVTTAQAAVDAITTQIAEGTIVSPIDGVITVENIKVGEIAAANAPAIEVISNGSLQVDAYVSEADISSIQVGQTGTVSLDSDATNTGMVTGTSTPTFVATVVSVDPAETTVNGANAYKVTLQFNETNPSIKPGMDGNVDFQIGQKANALAVPTSAIISNNGQQFVIVEQSSGATSEIPVTTGIVDPSGWTEIVSGIQAGDQVVTFGN